MKKKQFTALFLTAALAAAALLGGCGGQSSQSSQVSEGTDDGADASVSADPTPATLVLYGEESERMSDFAANELHERVLEEINVDLTVQYLPWSE